MLSINFSIIERVAKVQVVLIELLVFFYSGLFQVTDQKLKSKKFFLTQIKNVLLRLLISATNMTYLTCTDFPHHCHQSTYWEKLVTNLCHKRGRAKYCESI